MNEGYDVSNYLINLNYTENDAFKFINFLQSEQSGYTPDQNIIHLQENEATKANILYALNKLASVAKINDRVIFYFSGHGAPAGLCPYDFSSIKNNTITKYEIENIFNAYLLKSL